MSLPSHSDRKILQCENSSEVVRRDAERSKWAEIRDILLPIDEENLHRSSRSTVAWWWVGDELSLPLSQLLVLPSRISPHSDCFPSAIFPLRWYLNQCCCRNCCRCNWCWKELEGIVNCWLGQVNEEELSEGVQAEELLFTSRRIWLALTRAAASEVAKLSWVWCLLVQNYLFLKFSASWDLVASTQKVMKWLRWNKLEVDSFAISRFEVWRVTNCCTGSFHTGGSNNLKLNFLRTCQ